MPMTKRRAFLKQAGALTLLGPHVPLTTTPVMLAALTNQNLPSAKGREPLGWKPLLIKQGDGKGGWTLKSAEYQFLHRSLGRYVFPFGIVQMDNGEILLIGSWHDGKADDAAVSERPVITFSRDRGDSWTEFQEIPGAAGRPMML